MEESALEAATRHQVYLERLKTSITRDYLGVFKELGERIDSTLYRLEVDQLSELRKSELNEVLSELRDEQEEVILKRNEEFSKTLEDVSEYEVKFENKSLSNTTKKHFRIPKTSTVQNYYRNRPLSANGQLLDPFIKTWGSSHVSRIEDEVRRAYVNGNTLQDLRRAIRGTRERRFKDGIISTSTRQADAVARTSIQHVANSSRNRFWESNQDVIVGYRIAATLDLRTTSICRSMDGKEFEVGKGPTPPFHIGCRSTTVAKLSKEFDFLDEGATRASRDGYVDGDMTYYDWLKKQSRDEQEQILGVGRAAIFQKVSASKFAALNLDKNFQPITLEELRNKL